MIDYPNSELDSRDAARIVEELRARRPGFVPEWLPSDKGADAAVLQIFARYLSAVIERLNHAAEKNKLAFLDLLGVELIPARPARAIVVFKLADKSPDARMPAGTRLAAPPPPEHNEQVIFETDRATGLAAAKLAQVVSLWPGRDQYIDHTQDFLADRQLHLFRKLDLENTPHALYLAHDVLLSLSGKSNVDVRFELTTNGSERLKIIWEYWDGKVWREFLNARPACLEDPARSDGTAGLTETGAVHLETDCAETSKTKVNGIEAFWIRGRLDETLPPDPARILPEVDQITLSTRIAKPLTAVWTDSDSLRIGQPGLVVKAQDKAGAPISGVVVALIGTAATKTTDAQGIAKFSPIEIGAAASVSVANGEFTSDPRPLRKLPNRDTVQEYTFSLALDGMEPEKAFADATKLDTSKPFFPLGQQPQPGAAFYFSSDEIFSKPRADFRVYVQTAPTPQDATDVSVKDLHNNEINPSTPLGHSVSWEYWDGRKWSPLQVYSNNPNDKSKRDPRDFTATGFVGFPIPLDMASTKVNDVEAFWMRVRLNSGSFGFTQTVTWRDEAGNANKFTYALPQPPALSAFRLGYSWIYGPFHAEHVVAHNDFRYADRTEGARWPGASFQPYQVVRDDTPALYLGFDKPLPEDRMNIFFDIEERHGDTKGPQLEWQYWDGFNWERIQVDDETRDLRVPGLASFIAPADSELLARFGTPRHWIRARLKEDGPPGEPAINGIFHNAVRAIQRQTILDDVLGTSTAQPNQIFALRGFPVLAGRAGEEDERVEVRELNGARANVEWRGIATELFGSDPRTLADIEDLLGREGIQTDIICGDLRLRRDRNKHVFEVWVRWHAHRNFFFSGPDDRHFVIDNARGRVLFGDGDHGKIPPLGAGILAREYRTGGGIAGNVAARAISQLLGGVAGVESTFNPRPAEGGADTETLPSLSERGPFTLRHRGRAISPVDFETFAREASPAVAFARAVSNRDPGGRRAPGWLTLLILPESDDPRPWPSFGLREEVREYVEAAAPAVLAAAHRIYITGPDYLEVDVEATVVPVDPADAGAVERAALDALGRFLHPLHGGPEGRGWELGRDLFLSDVATVLEGVDGVDYVKELTLLLGGEPQGEHVPVASDRIVVAGRLLLKMVEA